MLISLSWFSIAVLLAVPQARTGVLPSLTPAQVVTDSTLLLTQEVIAPYTAIEKALSAYWVAHPNSKQLHWVAGGAADYSPAAQSDTGVASIFTKYHYTPAQFVMTQTTSYRAIRKALRGQWTTTDTATVAGKNVAFVQTHRTALAADWSAVEQAAQMLKQAVQQMQTGIQEQLMPQHDTMPAVTPSP